jgi:hypothetical protein
MLPFTTCSILGGILSEQGTIEISGKVRLQNGAGRLLDVGRLDLSGLGKLICHYLIGCYQVLKLLPNTGLRSVPPQYTGQCQNYHGAQSRPEHAIQTVQRQP